MKLLIDMNLSPLWVEFLAASGFESIHWSKVGDPAAPDCVIMDYAAANGLVIFTHDLDFGALLADRKSRQPSVIQDPHAGRSSLRQSARSWFAP
jgi:predicted nuclease of predicted toxin-antitoxin system